MILAIETATPVCSVALFLDSGRVVEKRIEGRGVHSERTFTFIQELLERHDLNVDDLNSVLFSNGPGSYTGLRIGAAAIKGLLFRRETPLYTLCTLTSCAVPFIDRAPVVIHSVIDARREHLYHRRSELRNFGQSDLDQADTDNRKKEKMVQSIEMIQSNPVVKEIKKLEKEIHPGEIVVGTGLDRISHNEREKIEWFGSEQISAVNLIHAWNHEHFKSLFKNQKVDQFEPEYLTMSQVNNSSI